MPETLNVNLQVSPNTATSTSTQAMGRARVVPAKRLGNLSLRLRVFKIYSKGYIFTSGGIRGYIALTGFRVKESYRDYLGQSCSQ